MAAFEDSFKSLLQGVSQQLPKDRLPGQNTEQLNMLSDPVTNLRRRPGAKFAYTYPVSVGSDTSIAAWSTSIGDLSCHVLVNSLDGSGQIIQYADGSSSYGSVLAFSNSYLMTGDISNLLTVSVGNELFFINREKIISKQVIDTSLTPVRRGFFDIVAGAFNKKYELTVTNPDAVTITVSYTTPSGAGAGDAALSTPAYIAGQLAGLINNTASFGITATPAGYMQAVRDVDGSTVFLFDTRTLVAPVNALKVTTTAGRAFITASGASYITSADALPAQLPHSSGNVADGYVVATGTAAAPVYYKWVYSTLSWLEVGDYLTSTPALINVPFSIRRGLPGTVEPALVPVYTDFEGRFAGDSISNPDPVFVGQRITGAASYEGRLVLLVGNTVAMSAAGKPRRFYRSTVTNLIDSDTISVGSTAAASAIWRQAVVYGKDLLLFSSRYQGVVAGGNAAITPRTAALRVFSEYAGDVNAAPINAGRTVLYMKPMSDTHFGVMELLASQYADSTYTSYESTAHLPRYMRGRCRQAAASSSANMAVFLSNHLDHRNEMIVHEYTWQGDQKVQQAWHTWSFELPIATAFFSGSRLHLVFVEGGRVIVLFMDPRASVSIADPVYSAPLDFSAVFPMVGGRTSIPGWMNIGMAAHLNDMRACASGTPLTSEPVAIEVSGAEFITTSGYPDGDVIIGLPFTSRVEPSPPMLKDHNGVKISTNKTTVTRFILGTNNSREFEVSVSDAHESVQQYEGDDPYTVSPLTFSSTELELGQALVGGPNSEIIIPARTVADSTRLVLSTNGTGDMNITSLEYVMKTKEHIQRKKG